MAVINPRNAITGRAQIKPVQPPAPRQVIAPPKVSPAELQQMRQKSQQAMKLAEQSRLNAQQMRQKADQMRQAMPVMPATTLPSQVTTQPAPRITTDPIQQNQQSFMDPSMISGFAGVGALPSPEYDIVGNVNMPFMGVPPQRLPSDAPSITHQNYGDQGGIGANNILSQIPAYAQMQALQQQLQGQQPNPQQLSQLQMLDQQIQNNPQMQQYIQQQKAQQSNINPNMGGGFAGVGALPPSENYGGGMGAMEWGVPDSITYGTTGGYNPQNTSYGSGLQPMGGAQNIGSLLGKG